ncbi:MAG: hypothetical protein K8R85_04660 [Bacteroidetes bacterium]|nr:hypothetical protein [Bacteroidota bacterium]
MNIIWEIGESDIKKVKDFVNEHKNPFVENRINRNVNKKGIVINKDEIIRTMLMCLLTTEHDSYQDKKWSTFFNKKPFLLTDGFLLNRHDFEKAVLEVLKSNGLTPSNRIINSFIINYFYLLQSKWEIITDLENGVMGDYTKSKERDLADNIDMIFKGFGSIQSRSFLQALGLTKYEIPINSIMIEWLKNFGFPILFSPIALQDKSFYHFISDGIQLLCERANIYPCVLEAAVFSFNDTDDLQMKT